MSFKSALMPAVYPFRFLFLSFFFVCLFVSFSNLNNNDKKKKNNKQASKQKGEIGGNLDCIACCYLHLHLLLVGKLLAHY